MVMNGKVLDNNALAALTRQAGPQIASAIKSASAKTGVDFAYLMEKAAAESSFKADAKAKTSSATGLFQFIESTWMDMVKKHGHKYGMGKLAGAIDANGKVDDPAVKEQILELRKNPKKAALLAAEFASGNKQHLEQHVGGHIGSTELYFAHFMGAGGAAGFLNAMKENPLTPAADLFPKAARANRNVFYDSKTGQPRTLAGVYEFFDRKFGDHGTAADTPLKTAPSAPMQTATKPSYERYQDSLRKQTIDMLMNQNHDIFSDRSVYKYISHPALGRIMQDMDYSWQRSPFMPQASNIIQPLEIMMLARLDEPGQNGRQKS